MASLRGFASGVAWTVFWDEMTDDDVERYLRDVYADLERAQAARRKVAGLTLSTSSAAPNAAQRRRIAASISDNGELLGATVAIFAYVLESAVARGALTAVNWIVRKPFPERTFATTREALDAIAAILPGVDPAAVLSDIEARVPRTVYDVRR